MEGDNSLSKEDLVQNLKEALAVEYKALAGYEDVVALFDNPTDRNIIDLIIADEKKHVKIVEGLIDLVNSCE